MVCIHNHTTSWSFEMMNIDLAESPTAMVTSVGNINQESRMSTSEPDRFQSVKSRSIY